MAAIVHTRCCRCGQAAKVPMGGITVAFHREEPSRDVLYWNHSGCGLSIGHIPPEKVLELNEYLARGEISRCFIPDEIGDNKRNLKSPITREEVAHYLHALGAATP